MAEGLEGTGREIVADNWFVSADAADALYDKRLYLTGTMRSSRKEIPKEFLPSKTRTEKTQLVGYNGVKSLTSHVCRKNRAVIFMTTDPELMSEPTPGEMPIVNSHYNVKKCGVDLLDKITKEVSLSKPTKRWPMVVFYSLLEMILHNSFILFILKFPEWEKGSNQRREIFLKNLAYRLAEKHVQDRLLKAQKGGIHTSIKLEMNRFLENVKIIKKDSPAANTCTDCSIQQNLDSCANCGNFVCRYHAKKRKEYVCHDCFGGDTLKHRAVKGITICYYCRGTKRKTEVKCKYCKACVCSSHRTYTGLIICSNCKDPKSKQTKKRKSEAAENPAKKSAIEITNGVAVKPRKKRAVEVTNEAAVKPGMKRGFKVSSGATVKPRKKRAVEVMSEGVRESQRRSVTSKQRVKALNKSGFIFT